jgi:hypothetical protein
VPYDHIDVGSALLHMWTYVGAPKCRAIVAIGATAGLSVAMFGSMFPMPRVRRRIFCALSFLRNLMEPFLKLNKRRLLFSQATPLYPSLLTQFLFFLLINP